MTDLYWTAVYNDDTNLSQFNEDGTENGYGAIERDKLTEFHVHRREDNQTVFAMEITEGQRLVYRKRNSISGNTGEMNWTIYLIGWQKTVNGENVQSLNWIFPDGAVVNTGRYQENHQLFYAPEYFDFELEP
jgi:hypothetical protein